MKTTEGLEEIGVSEARRTKRSKFGVFARSDQREEREFAEFQGPLRSSRVMEAEGPQSIYSQGPLAGHPVWP